MRHITTIIFDLDDTLWDLPQVIGHAENTIYEWFERHYPAITRRFDREDLRRLRNDIGAEFPEMRHDLMFLREQTYRRIAAECGYSESLYKEAFEVFQQARNEVVLYPDVAAALHTLGSNYRLLALSNGNADLVAIGLDSHFDGIYGARELGRAKPDPQVFLAVCEHAGIATGEALHVGDDPYNDVAAPGLVGMDTVWVNRRGRAWPADLAAPRYEISDLSPLAVMLSS
jgi:putative hydrolase of the HAD superfamily